MLYNVKVKGFAGKMSEKGRKRIGKERKVTPMDERMVSEIVASVVKSMTTPKQAQKGVFSTMTEALAAVDKAYKQYKEYSIEQREKRIAKIR